MTESKAQLATTTDESVYASIQTFENAQRMAKSLAQSNLVPDLYRGQNGFSNCLVALEIANRMKMSPLQVMQNINIIKGKPSWSATFIIAMIQSRYDDLDYEMSGKGETLACKCVATRRRDKKKVEGSTVSIKMAQDEGWTKNPKWRSMPEHMLKFRAATFFGRQYIADLLAGIQTEDEVVDIEPVEINVSKGKVTAEEVKGQEGERRLPNTPHEAAIATPEKDDFGF